MSTPSAPLTVTLAEDDYLMLAGIQALIERIDGVEILALCADFDELMASVAEQPPHVVITDIRMPPTNEDEGIRAANLLSRSHPDVGVIVLSQFIDPALATSFFAAGTRKRGYILKENVTNEHYLATAIQAVAKNGSFIDPDALEALVTAREKGPGGGIDRLSEREREVLAHVAKGHNNRAIADELFIGERSVEKHISSIFSKLELRRDDDTHRRVTAVLLYLADTGGSTFGG